MPRGSHAPRAQDDGPEVMGWHRVFGTHKCLLVLGRGDKGPLVHSHIPCTIAPSDLFEQGDVNVDSRP